MVYLPERFEVSSPGPREPLERGGLWRLDEILPAAVEDLLSSWEGTSAADGMAEFAAAQAEKLPGRSRSPWIATPTLNPSPLESHESAAIGGAVSIF